MEEHHVQQLVGFFESYEIVVADATLALCDQSEQAAGRVDEKIDALWEVANLAIDRHAAEDGRDAELGEASIVATALRDLRGEFAGRRKDEHAATARRGPLGVVQQIVERRQRKGRGLAGAGLREIGRAHV